MDARALRSRAPIPASAVPARRPTAATRSIIAAVVAMRGREQHQPAAPASTHRPPPPVATNPRPRRLSARRGPWLPGRWSGGRRSLARSRAR
eukprot:scaffold4914_cov202-Prasinococcus_capsulatus_cf.AAC.1